MTAAIIGFGIAFACGLILTRLVEPLARRLNAVDKPDGYRKIHSEPVPRLGGIAVFAAFALPVLALIFIWPSHEIALRLVDRSTLLCGLFAGGLVAFGMGVIDDLANLKPRWKLLFQIIAASVAIYCGYTIEIITIPLIGTIDLGWVGIPFTLFWFLGCMNAINLMDGLDGLAAGISLFVILTLMLLCLLTGRVSSMFLMACLGGATLGFLIRNFYPARIFLGDSGSMFLGFCIAALSLHASVKSHATVALIIPMIALGLPIFDTAVAILRRWTRRLPISVADRQHIHHVLLKLGLGHRTVVLTLYGICIVLGGLALFAAFGHDETVLMVLGALAIIAFVSVRIVGGVRFREMAQRVSQDYQRRGLSGEARRTVQAMIYQIQGCNSLRDVWDVCCKGFPSLGVDHVAICLKPDAADEAVCLKWPCEHQNTEMADIHDRCTEPRGWFARYALTASDGNTKVGELTVYRCLDDRLLIYEIPELMTQLSTVLAGSIHRILQRGRKELKQHIKDLSPHATPVPDTKQGALFVTD